MAHAKALLLTPCGRKIECSMPVYRDQVERLIGGWIEVIRFQDGSGALLCSDTFLFDRQPRNATAEALVPGKCICGPALVLERDVDIRRVLRAYSWQKGPKAPRIRFEVAGLTGQTGTVDFRNCSCCDNAFTSTVGSFEVHCYPCRRRFGNSGLVRNADGQLVPPETLTVIEAE